MYNVYTYFEDLPGVFSEERALLELCRKSWEQQGWNFHVLTREDAEKNSAFELVANNEHLVKGSSSPLTKSWELCSYFRWLALSSVAGFGLLIDYDMINYNFPAQKLEPSRYHGRDQFSSDVPAGLSPPTPCKIRSVPLINIITLFATYQGEPDGDNSCPQLKKECTDQLLLHFHGTRVGPLTWSDEPWCHMYGSPGWREAPVVHYTHWSIAQQHTADRLMCIELERPL
jgi:hypothetical protein